MPQMWRGPFPPPLRVPDARATARRAEAPEARRRQGRVGRVGQVGLGEGSGTSDESGVQREGFFAERRVGRAIEHGVKG